MASEERNHGDQGDLERSGCQSRDAEPSQSSEAPAVFSMAHALSRIRQRQQEQRRAREEEEKRIEEEKKERAREKRRRRRRNQKDRKAKSRAEATDEADQKDSDKEANCPGQDLDVCMENNEESGSQRINLKRSADDDLKKEVSGDSVPECAPRSSRPAKKRLKLKHDTSIDQESAEAKIEQNSTKLKSFIPRALLLKKRKVD